MATPQDIAVTVEGLRDELASRIDNLKASFHIDGHAYEAVGGIIEGLSSVCRALAKCDGVPSADSSMRAALNEAAPDLLSIAKHILALTSVGLDGENFDRSAHLSAPAFYELKAAIAKAEGRAS